MTRHIMPISGKDSLATALVQTKAEPGLGYEYLFCDVEMELPETLAWLARVETYLGVTLHRVGRSLEEVIAHHNMLPSPQKRFCTPDAKIKPMRDWLGEDEEATQYVGIRADEEMRVEQFVTAPNITVRFPLVEHGIDLAGVYRLLDETGLATPDFHWARLEAAVYDLLSPAAAAFADTLPRWTRASLFSWRSRSNCYMCFYQRMYEWLGLLEFHPDLFDKAAHLEWYYGNPDSPVKDNRLKKAFTFREYGPLQYIRARRVNIFDMRVRQVRDQILGLKGQRNAGKIELDMLSRSSCGTYCGK